MAEAPSHDAVTTQTQAPPTLRVSVTADKLAVLVTVADPHADLQTAASKVLAALEAEEIPNPFDTDALAERLANACSPDEHLVNYAIMAGTPPITPRHGRLEWMADFFAEGFATDTERDTVNYRERAEDRAVTAGQVLAQLWMPHDGQPGVDVFGNKIPVDKPRKERLRAGKGVRVEPEGDDSQRFIAEMNGRLRLTDGTVMIDEVFTIKGNVNLATGNIRHTGTVIVTGDVEAGSRIEADGDIVVKGLVEPSDIVCGGSLAVTGGIVGDGDHRLEVVGSVDARYLNDVRLRLGGNLRVQSEIVHCEIRCSGKITIPQGRIAGGYVQAYKGIEVGYAGAESARDTVLATGIDWRFEDQLKVRKDTMAQLSDARRKLMNAVQLLAGRREPLTDEMTRTLADLRAKVQQIDQALQRESQQQIDLGQESIAGAVREVTVHKGVFNGTTFQLGAFRTRAISTIVKPRRVALRKNVVRILPGGEDPTIE